MTRAGVIAAAVAALLAWPPAATAQRLSPSVALTAAEHRVDIGAGVEVSSGTLITAGIQSTLGSRWIAGVDATVGALTSDGNGVDRDVGQLRFTLGFRLLPWLAVEAGFGTRMYSAAIARQRWTAASLAAEGRLSFADSRFAGTGRVALQPSPAVSGLDGPNAALAAAAGVEYRGARLTFGVSYWLERYEFPSVAAVIRHEQLAGLTARAAWSPGRRR